MKHLNIVLIILIVSSLFSCKKFIEIEPPKNSLVPVAVFKTNELATSALLGIYLKMATSGFACGDYNSISVLCGLTADEYLGYGVLLPFSENQITPETVPNNSFLWIAMYSNIYNANSILEGLERENGVTPPVKIQLEGEALFIRAFIYFYLVNLYGAVPLHLSTDYRVNSNAVRTPVTEIYTQIIKDLQAAESRLNDSYITTERVRPNKSAVHALMSRTYLYLGDWTNAEKYASMVIGKTGIYNLTGLNEVFLKNSAETIWQLMPAANSNTPAGSVLILTTAPTHASLRTQFVTNTFEVNDQRKTAWVKSFTVGTGTYYYPFKYKVKSSSTVSEYTMVLRLAEQYLIRAEARAKQNNLSGAIADIDAIRKRAGLSLIKDANPNFSLEDLLNIIQKERFTELFSEWGDRWFDLKRTGKVTGALSAIKPGWKSTCALFPIPISEIGNNQKITQNDGY